MRPIYGNGTEMYFSADASALANDDSGFKVVFFDMASDASFITSLLPASALRVMERQNLAKRPETSLVL